MRKSTGVFWSLILALALLFSGCAGQQAASDNENKASENQAVTQVYSGEEGRITIYLSGPEQMLADLENAFEQERGDVLNILPMGCGPLAQKVCTEAEAGGIQADVIWGAEPLLYMNLREKGLLQQYTSPEAEAIKPEYKMGDNYYTLCNARYGVIVYNREKVAAEEIPSFWADLTKSNWKGRVAIADAGQSAMALALTAGLLQINDGSWEYLQSLKDNRVILTKQNNQAVEMVSTGEADAAIVPHDGVLRAIKSDKKKGIDSSLAIAWPEEGAISVQRPIAIIANEARPDANNELCQEFINFVLAPSGQQIAAKYGFVSVRNDQELPAGVPNKVQAITLDWENASANDDEIRENFEKIMTEL